MKTIRDQVEAIDPSASDALFRRLLAVDELGFLRDEKTGKTIIGFEVVLDQPQIPGFTIIAIQKHTILAYRSDLDEEKRLILFPSMDKIQDPEFGLQDIIVQRKIFTEDTFTSQVIIEGPLRDVAKDLIPPYKTVDIPDEMADSLNRSLINAHFEGRKDAKQAQSSTNTPVNDTPPMDAPMDAPFEDELMDVPFDAPFDEPSMDAPMEAPMDVPFDTPFDEPFDDFGGYDQVSDNFSPEPEPIDTPPQQNSEGVSSKIYPKTPRAIELHNQKFTSISDVSDYVVIHFNVPADFASNVINVALQSATDRQTQIDVAVLLFVKLFNDDAL